MNKNPSLEAGLDAYSVAARTVLNLKKPAMHLGDLALYTAAAGSALALAPVAEAAIIYSGIQNISVNRVTNGSSFKSVDLNFDGQGDFSFSISSSAITTFGAQTDGAVAHGTRGTFPGANGSALFFNRATYLGYASSLLKLAASSRTIGANYGLSTYLSFFAGLREHSVTTGGSYLYGLWNPGPAASSTGLAGVLINPYNPAGYQFGWLRFKLTTNFQNRTDSLTLIDWAFESVSGRSIHVGAIPEPSTLSLLALGAAGLALLRRRRGQEKQADAVY